MTINEFKAWFKGYTEAMTTEKPTKAQWDRLKAEIDVLAFPAPAPNQHNFGILGGIPMGPGQLPKQQFPRPQSVGDFPQGPLPYARSYQGARQ